MATERLAGYDAVILAGGRARRFGGADKPGAHLAGRALVDRVAGAVAGAGTLVLVGPPRPGLPRAVVAREEPPGAGPVPALRAGLPRVRAPWTALLAADLPFLRAADIAALRAAADRAGDGAVLIDDGGREQWLAGVWRTAALRAALAGYRGGSLRGLLGPLLPERVAVPAGDRPPWYDCDTPEAMERARRLAEAAAAAGEEGDGA